MKKTSVLLHFLLFLLACSESVHAQNYAGEAIKMFENLKIDDDYEKYARCHSAIRYDPSLEAEVRDRLKIKFWIIACRFLKTHSYPEGQTYSNMAPPDGSMSGIDPKHVKDPVSRAQYVKMLSDNEKLIKAQSKYRDLSRVREQTADSIFLKIESQPGYLNIIASVLNESAKNPEESNELMGFIDQAAIKRGAKPPARNELPK